MLQNNKMPDIAVVGAGGLVGSKVIEVLTRRGFCLSKLTLFGGNSTKGMLVPFGGQKVEILELNNENIVKNRVDIAFFCVESEVSKAFAPLFAALGAVVIDNSSAFRLDEGVPLVIPSVNPSEALLSAGIIANPNCSTIIALSVLGPLSKKYPLKRVIFNTYQAVSGAGAGGIRSLKDECADYCGKDGSNRESVFSKPILHNVIPQIGCILSGGYTIEEQKMIDETKKILGNSNLSVTATAVRVPVFCGHSISINAQFSYSPTLADINSTLTEAGIKIVDCPTPLEAQNSFDVFAGRIRRDFSNPDTFNFWVVSDNILKGAALNAVEIAELLI